MLGLGSHVKRGLDQKEMPNTFRFRVTQDRLFIQPMQSSCCYRNKGNTVVMGRSRLLLQTCFGYRVCRRHSQEWYYNEIYGIMILHMKYMVEWYTKWNICWSSSRTCILTFHNTNKQTANKTMKAQSTTPFYHNRSHFYHIIAKTQMTDQSWNF